MNILEELDVIDPLLSELDQKPVHEQELDEFGLTKYSKTLKITLERGRAFKQWKEASKTDKFYISVCGFGQKFKTNSYLKS